MQSVVVDIGTDITKKPKVRQSFLEQIDQGSDFEDEVESDSGKKFIESEIFPEPRYAKKKKIKSRAMWTKEEVLSIKAFVNRRGESR